MLDSLEHIADWQGVLLDVIFRLKDKGALITNYFMNQDYKNPEHISMDKPAVIEFLNKHGVYAFNDYMWIKQDIQHTRQEKVA